MRFSFRLAFVATAFSFAAPLLAAPGDLDTGFGTEGKVVTPVGSSGDYGQAVALQPDGKVLVAGYSRNSSNNYDFALVRYNADGTLDTNFDGDGKVMTPVGALDDLGHAMALQPDGKILVAGTTDNGTNNDFAVVRYNTDGSLDTTFDGDGKVTTAVGAGQDWAYTMALQSDGKILVAGSDNGDFALVRYNSDGTLDSAFGSGGKVITSIGTCTDAVYSLTLQPDGKILAAGSAYSCSQYDFALARYNSDGTLDTTFDGDGKVITPLGSSFDIAYAIALQTDGQILAGGYSRDSSNNDDFAIVRYNADGSLDTSFDGDGVVTTPVGSGNEYGRAIALQSDGKILVAGYSLTGADSDIAVARYSADGTLDTSFGVDGKVVTSPYAFPTTDEAWSMVLQPDGKLLVAGSSGNDFALVRYLTSTDGGGDGGGDGGDGAGGASNGGGGPSDPGWLFLMAGVAALRFGRRCAG
jgi:uncharacterized delta-60 repeat protein